MNQGSKQPVEETTIVSVYNPNTLYPYLDADPHQEVSGEVIELSEVNTQLYAHGIMVTISLPGVKAGMSAHVAWCSNALVQAIDSISITSSTMIGKYSITGSDIEDILQWYRNDTIDKDRWLEMLGNAERLQQFNKELKPYHNSFIIPLFFNEEYPLHLPDLAKQQARIVIKLKNVRDLLRVTYLSGGRKMNLDYGNPSAVDTIYRKCISINGSVSCRTSFRATRCPQLREFSQRLYSTRYLPTYKEFRSESDVINRDHKKELTLDCNVTAFMWKLEAIYSGLTGSEADIHTMGCYSIDPLGGSDIDPVSTTSIEITYKDGTTKTWNLLDTESKQTNTEGVSNPFRTGYHYLDFGANPFRGLKSEGIPIRKATITCRSSDHSDITHGSDATEIDEDDNLIDDEESEEEDMARRARRVPDRRLVNEPSRIISSSEGGIKYRLVVRAVIATVVEIDDSKMTFRSV